MLPLSYGNLGEHLSDLLRVTGTTIWLKTPVQGPTFGWNVQVTLFRRNDMHVVQEQRIQYHRVAEGSPHQPTTFLHGRSLARVHQGLKPYKSHRWTSNKSKLK